MATSTSPKATQQQEAGTTKEQELQSQLITASEVISTIEALYKANESSTNIIINNKSGLDKGPWKIQAAANTTEGKDSIFDYMLSNPFLNLIKSSIPNYIDFEYKNIFSIGLTRINDEGGLKQLLTQAQSEAANLDIQSYQKALSLMKDLISNELLNKIEIYNQILSVVSANIIDYNSPIYKGENSYGPFSKKQITEFTLPAQFIEMQENSSRIINFLKRLFTILDKALNVTEDVLTRVNLNNIGLTQDPENADLLNTQYIEEKDPWGIRFSYTKYGSTTSYIENINTENNARSNRVLTHDNQTREENSFIETPNSVLNKSVTQRKDFYFQLLPAIKSNLPVSAGTDVPGAMPGIQFRIENNIVKHRIPGFAPVYQPIGIDSIKCTLVGMFSGNDGVDISKAYSDDLNTGLLLPNKDAAFGNRDLTNKYNDGASSPIPSLYKPTTSSNVAILSEDAFKGAQDFYNEIVSTGQEVEVELNLRKGTLPFAGGAPGPFRDEITGNPKFKGLIKKLDLYYVRRDRCWFIIDLEITNSGLISNKCINLTNTIEEAVELFEKVEDEPTGLTKEQLDKCFKDPKEIKYKNEKSGYALVVDKSSGLSYEYRIDTKTLRDDKNYPTSTLETLAILQREIPNFNSRAENKGTILKLIVDILVNSTQSIKTDPNDKSLKFATNKVKVFETNTGFNKSIFAVYNKNDGLFYTRNKKGDAVESFTSGRIPKITFTKKVNKKTLKEIASLNVFDGIDYTESKSFSEHLQESLRFFVEEYAPLVTFKPNSCDKTQKQNDKKQAKNSGDPQQPLGNNSSSTANNTLKQKKFFKEDPALNNLQAVSEKARQLKDIKTQAEEGVFTPTITSAVNDTVNLLKGNNIDEANSSLTPQLISTLKNNFKVKKLYFDATQDDFSINIDEKTIRPNNSKSNENELELKLVYNVNFPARIISGSKQYTVYPKSTSVVLIKPAIKEITLKLQTFSQGERTIYKVNSIKLIST
jgi:hypothetical protein